MKKTQEMDVVKQKFFEKNKIDLSIMRELNKCISNDVRCNEIKHIINSKVDKLIILNDTLNNIKNNEDSKKYITAEISRQIVLFNNLVKLGHKILV